MIFEKKLKKIIVKSKKLKNGVYCYLGIYYVVKDKTLKAYVIDNKCYTYEEKTNKSYMYATINISNKKQQLIYWFKSGII